MKTPVYILKDTAGRGFLQRDYNTAFDLPRNWGKLKGALTFPDNFPAASATAQTLRRGAVEIVDKESQK